MESENTIMQGVPRGVPDRYRDQQKVPQARWQDPQRIKSRHEVTYDPDAPGDKILVGALDEQLIGISDNRHVLTVAGSRAGKSVTLAANLLNYGGSAVVMDPKGELAILTAERRALMGQEVFILDPFGYTDDRLAPFRAAYNPLSILQPGNPTFIEDANIIADALVIQASGNKDPHWDESAMELIEGLILHAATDPRYEGERDLVTVRDMLRSAMTFEPKPEDGTGENGEDDEPFYILEREMLENAARLQKEPETRDIGFAIEGAARSFYEKSDREGDSVLSTARRHTKFLDYSALRTVLRGNDFDLRDLKRAPQGMTIYICFPATRIEMSRRLLRILINQLLDAAEREKTVPAAPVLACLDEFPVLGYMRQLENAAGQIASFGVKLWVVIQDWGQGKALYGERWETFVGNAGVLQFFGNNDVTTTEYVSRKLGKTAVDVTRRGEVGREQQQAGLSGRSSSAELHDLLTPDEVSRLFARSDKLKRQLVIWAGYHPMIVQRVEYYDETSPVHWAFAGKYPRS